MHMIQDLNKSRLANIFFVLLAVSALTVVAACKEPTTGEKIENAAEELGDGVEDAADEFDNRSPMEKMGDSIEDAGDEIQDAAE